MNWWKHGVIYQIYPRSFMDSNGDGIGDLRGLIQKLDYLNDGTELSLGVDAIWLSPVFTSPMEDFGYDISDYRSIDPIFGTMDDFDDLLEAAHQRNIHIIIDLVLNHTSDLHPWFQESIDPDSDKADWYIWYEGEEPPNNWLSCFGGNGWTWHPKRKAWYFHSFLPEQPDLNWRNPEVKQAIREMMEFWLDKGVDGFRLDVANLYFKSEKLESNPVDLFRIARPYDRQQHLYDRDQPELHELYQDMRQWVDQYEGRMMVGEIMIADIDNASIPASYYGSNDQLHLAFNFEMLRAPFDATAFRRIIRKWITLLGPENWPNYTLSNHDVKRHVFRYGTGPGGHQRARLMACMLLTLRGTPFLYYGEEIGMPEQRVARDDIQDPVGKYYWPLYPGRDGCRRPMMWDYPINSFTEGTSWLPEEPVDGHSVAQQIDDKHSLFSWYRKLIWLRKRTPALHKGSLRVLDSEEDVLAYERSDGNECRLMVLLNFSANRRTLTLHRHAIVECLMNSDHDNPELEYEEGMITLSGYQALVLRLEQDYPKKAVV